MSRDRHIFGRIVNICWPVFKWGLLLGLVALAVAFPQLYRRIDEEIRLRVERHLAEFYPGMHVHVRSAVLVEGEGICVRDVVITDPNAESPQAELIRVEEVVLGCQTTLAELVQHGEPQFTHAIIRRPTIHARLEADGQWNILRLYRQPRKPAPPIEVRVESGVVEISDPRRQPAGVITLRDIAMTFVPVADEAAGTAETMEAPNRPPTASIDAPSPPKAPRPTAKFHYQFRGVLTGDHLKRFEFAGTLDRTKRTFAINGTADGLTFSPELHAALPTPLAEQAGALAGLRGEASLTFALDNEGDAENPYRFQSVGQLVGGRLDDARLPHALTDVRAKFRVANEGVAIDDLTAHSHQAAILLNYRQRGFSPNSPKLVEAQARQLELDRRLFDVLPEQLREQWHRYRPTGQIDANARLTFDGRSWQPDVDIRCLNVSFSHHRFPYRLEDCRGSLTLKQNRLSLQMVSQAGVQPIYLDAELDNPGEHSVGWFEAKGADLPIDAKLMTALNDQTRNVVQSLRARGSVAFAVRLWRTAPDTALRRHLILQPQGMAIQYEKFPYPLRNIRGTLELNDETWTFRNMEANNDAGRVFAEGHLQPTVQGNELYLKLRGEEVALDADLRDALGPHQRQAWLSFRPRGTVDIAAEVRYLCEPKQLSVAVRAEPHGESVWIEPVAFPLRMEKFRGAIIYRDGVVTFDKLRAEHGAMRLATGGTCTFSPDGHWRLRLEGLTVDRLRLDRDMLQAVPDKLKRAFAELKPTGPLSVTGAFELESPPVPGDPLLSRWDVAIGMQQAAIDCGLKLENISGSMTLIGQSDGRQMQSRGELLIDSLMYKDAQFTDVRGPVWIDDRQVLFGSAVAKRASTPHAPREVRGSPHAPREGAGTPHAPREGPAAGQKPQAPPEPPRPLLAKLFGGTVYCDGWVLMGQTPEYAATLQLSGASLARCAQEMMPGPQNLRGMIAAVLNVHGTGRTVNGLKGHGNIQLRDADVYELPFMIAMLKLLSIRAPDTNAFSRASMDFRIAGEHVYFDQIDFHGDAISLLGKGEMDFEQRLKLNFHAMVGRGDANVPILSKLVTSASRQTMLIQVGGTLRQPEFKRQALPGLNRAIQNLQGEQAHVTAPPQ